MKYKGVPIGDIVIYKHPAIYLGLVLDLGKDLLLWFKNFFIQNFIFILLAVILVGLINHVQFLQPLHKFLVFAAYWILLGVASSIGLGTGLHTFVLYLGPHIAKVTMVATSCGHLPPMLPSRWQFDHFGKCEQSSETIGFWGILQAVQLEAFLWGFGTALGELPPYFVARKAAETNQELLKMELKAETNEEQRKKLLKNSQEIDEVEMLKHKANKTFMEKAKIAIYNNLQNYGFITILACASIPNPLFDLAGITCGHFKIPFKKFFTATFIGKAIIKVHIQMIFVITIFRKQTMDAVLAFIGSINKSWEATLAASMQKQRELLFHPSQFHEDKPLVAQVWDVFIILMIGYFILSIITSLVQEKAVQHKDKEN